jgi:hypothetical protein
MQNNILRDHKHVLLETILMIVLMFFGFYGLLLRFDNGS